jgi:hypothetical protein
MPVETLRSIAETGEYYTDKIIFHCVYQLHFTGLACIFELDPDHASYRRVKGLNSLE